MELSHSADPFVKGEIIGWYKRDEICQRSAYSCTIELRLKSVFYRVLLGIIMSQEPQILPFYF